MDDFVARNLKLNARKSKFMVIGRSNAEHSRVHIKSSANQEIETTARVCYTYRMWMLSIEIWIIVMS